MPRLPVSKVDWQAQGWTRTWHCPCDRDLPCVMHILRHCMELLKDAFNGTESALFPTARGEVCAQQSVVDTIRRAVDLSGGSAKDAHGSWRISGNTFRITGARTLSKMGARSHCNTADQQMGQYGCFHILGRSPVRWLPSLN